MKRNAKGFTLIELLIVVAIIGIIVAIAIPNLLNAIQRAKQRRTMGDIRSIATAIEAYAVDMNRYPPAAGAYDLPVAPAGRDDRSAATMYNYVSPTYIKAVPLADGWNSWFLYATDTNGTVYVLVSAGKDGSTSQRHPADGPDDRLQRGHHLRQRFRSCSGPRASSARRADDPVESESPRASARGLFRFRGPAWRGHGSVACGTPAGASAGPGGGAPAGRPASVAGSTSRARPPSGRAADFGV